MTASALMLRRSSNEVSLCEGSHQHHTGPDRRCQAEHRFNGGLRFKGRVQGQFGLDQGTFKWLLGCLSAFHQ